MIFSNGVAEATGLASWLPRQISIWLPSQMLEELIFYCRTDNRVCPLPMQWNQLFQMLPNVRRQGLSWEPAPPLILAAWYSSAEKKRERLELHIRWADAHGALKPAAEFLYSLPDGDWFRDADAD